MLDNYRRTVKFMEIILNKQRRYDNKLPSIFTTNYFPLSNRKMINFTPKAQKTTTLDEIPIISNE